MSFTILLLSPDADPSQPEEISRAVLFFATDLSRVITGQTLDVNCGRYLH